MGFIFALTPVCPWRSIFLCWKTWHLVGVCVLTVFIFLQQLVSQQKDSDVEEKQKLTQEKEAQQRRITQLAEESAKLKTELAR